MNTAQSPEGNVGNQKNPSTPLLLDAFGRVQELVPTVVHGLSAQELTWRPDADANSVGWLVWHLSRVQDNHLAEIGGSSEVWIADGWSERFALPYPESAIGYGQSSDSVGQFFVDDPSLLSSYHDSVQDMTAGIISRLSPEDYGRVIDESFDPPVTIGTRLISVINDITQHVGQAAYVRGIIDRRRP